MSDTLNRINTIPGTEIARRIVFYKGIFDVFLSLSLIYTPSLLYDGPIPHLVTKMTGLGRPSWSEDPAAAYGLAALIMGAAFAGIIAGQSPSPDAHKTVATLNGVFALTGLIGCFSSPKTFGSSFLLLASLQDVFWFTAIVRAGQYGILDTLGLVGSRYLPEPVKKAISTAKEGTENVVQTSKDVGGTALDVSGKVGGAIGATATEGGRVLRDTTSAVGDGIGSTATSAKRDARNTAETIGRGASGSTATAQKGVSDASNVIGGGISQTTATAQKGVSDASNVIGGGISQLTEHAGLN